MLAIVPGCRRCDKEGKFHSSLCFKSPSYERKIKNRTKGKTSGFNCEFVWTNIQVANSVFGSIPSKVKLWASILISLLSLLGIRRI